MATMVNCPYCGKLTDPKLDGCPHCGGYLKKKRPAQPPVSSTPSQTCPSCQAVVQRGDIICVVCGTNLLTGQKVADAPSPSASGGGTGVSTAIAASIGLAIVAIIVIAGFVYLNNADTLGRARGLIADFKYPEANELLQDYVNSNPDDDEAWYELGKLQRRAKQYDAATESFQTVISINPGNVDAGLQALLCVQLSSQNYSIDQDIAILERVAENAPDNAQVWHLLALALGARGGEQDAVRQIDALERVISLSPDSDSAKLNLGVGQILAGNYRDARFTLDSVRDGNLQGDAQASLALIDVLDASNDRAVVGLERALTENNLSIRWEAQTTLAQLLIAQGRFREAEGHLQSALSENPNNEFGRYLRGIALHALNRPNEALEEYEAVSRLQGPYTGLATVQAANVHLVLNNLASAERMIGIARRAGVSTPAYHTVFGRVQNAIGNSASAVDAYNTAIRMDPAYAPAYLERGLAYVKMNRFDDGVNDLNRYLDMLGRDSIGTRANEVRLLTNQLQRTMTGGQGR